MKFLAITISAVLVLVGSLLLVNAGRYSSHQSYPSYGGNNNHNSGYGSSRAASSYHGRNSNYGPYHSYAVRPAVYGGHGLYSYRGYARYPPAPAAHYRAPRSYKKPAPARYNNHQASRYNLKPVKAYAMSTYSDAGNYGGHAQRYRYQAAPAYNRGYSSSGYSRPTYGHGHQNSYVSY